MNAYFISDLLEACALPPLSLLLTFLIGLMLSFRWRMFGKFLMALAIISLWLLSTPMVANALLEPLQKRYSLFVQRSFSAADAIVVLGGGGILQVEEGNKFSVACATMQRLNYAAQLSKRTKLPIIVSGGPSNISTTPMANVMAIYLHDHFGLATYLQETRSLNTADEGKYLAQILAEHKIHRILLVTNAWHMRRSVLIFSANHIDVIPAPMGFYQAHATGYLNIIPNAEALQIASITLHEYLGMIWYWLR